MWLRYLNNWSTETELEINEFIFKNQIILQQSNLVPAPWRSLLLFIVCYCKVNSVSLIKQNKEFEVVAFLTGIHFNLCYQLNIPLMLFFPWREGRHPIRSVSCPVSLFCASTPSAGKDGVILYNTGSADLTLQSEGPRWWSNSNVCSLSWVGMKYLLNWYAACCCLLITKTEGPTKWLVCEYFSTSWLEKWTSVEAWDQSTPHPPLPHENDSSLAVTDYHLYSMVIAAEFFFLLERDTACKLLNDGRTRDHACKQTGWLEKFV